MKDKNFQSQNLIRLCQDRLSTISLFPNFRKMCILQLKISQWHSDG